MSSILFYFFSSQKNFFVKHIVLIFSLIRTAIFLSIYKNNVRLLLWHIDFKKRKALKKEWNEELVAAAWHPRRWWNFACPKMRKRKQNRLLLSNAFNASVVYHLKVLKHFVQKSFWISCHIDTENNMQRPDIVQNVSCLILRHFVSEYTY